MNFRDSLGSHPEIAYIYVNIIKPEMQTTSDPTNVVKVLSFYPQTHAQATSVEDINSWANTGLRILHSV